MNSIFIKGTSQYPEITLDKSAGRFEFTGNSIPEDAKEFFSPIFEWLDEYIANPNQETVVCFKMSYYNTPSSKMFFHIFKKLESLKQKGFSVRVKWTFTEEDMDMRDAGHDFAENTGIPVELIAIPEED